MSKLTLEYKEEKRILEVDGVEYELPQRTAELEVKIREHDNKIFEMSEYDCNISMLEILFGKAKTKKMFPEKEKTNLDKLARCVRMAIELYMTSYKEIQKEDYKEAIK